MRIPIYDVPSKTLTAHMADPRMAEHMPLLPPNWTLTDTQAFLEAKRAKWQADGLGHWGLFEGARYLGWGGFEKDGPDWDFGLVLSPTAFGRGWRITRDLLEIGAQDGRMETVTFLLPPSRKHLRGLSRLGANFEGHVTHAGADFRKYRLRLKG